jgi:excinuclease ABC subunit A
VIDVGPYSGQHGGEIVFQGTFDELKHDTESITAAYISGKQTIPQPKTRRQSKHFIQINGACLHNLQNIDVQFPLATFTAVTGVSGSGKTSLIKGILYPELKRHLEDFMPKTEKTLLSGDVNALQAVEFVDQNPIGRSSRSNPATYIGAFDLIRQYYAEQQLSKFRGYKAGFFSLNVEGGRCEVCQGEGKIRIGMQFMSDVEIICDNCKGNRYKEEVFDIKIAGKTIADVLNFTVEEAIAFFSSLQSDRLAKNIVSALKPLQDVGLDYLQLGQSSSSLSGGEAQRVKLASFLGKASENKKTLFIFDEPTTGLHYHDINKLYQTFQLLVDKGNTVLVIEHNLELIKCADWIIDLGPQGGKRGGQLVFAGTPENIIHCTNSLTGKFLANSSTFSAIS